MAGKNPTVLQWVIDTRNLFPEATETKQLQEAASRYLSLVSVPERSAALKYVFPRDAKLSLVSSLLKRHAISLTTSLPWPASEAARDPRGKPVFLDSDGHEPLAFNVSHQDGLVVLFGIAGYSPGAGQGQIEVGVDVVSCAERRPRDLETIQRAGGWADFVSVYDSVFSPAELSYLKFLEVRGVGVDERLRYFYALWCLKEAYVKMTGDALLADWILRLEFRDFKPPRPEMQGGDGAPLVCGEVVGDIEVLRDGKKDSGVRMELMSLGTDYMIGIAVRTPKRPEDAFGFQFGKYEMVDIEEIHTYAESHMA
ncbi:hypothetical protein jhhlp_000548 [Lomentospora prolificans]|uniref:holo-[acyl-carrier-protein] synthase n=1 Tax=Lomentospora prolificans TaxID=41688 RepID=A0A2N3NL85_9PEZI|nr:hypothetical protein jhhlp_000548 [Lomentospora prolificans]